MNKGLMYLSIFVFGTIGAYLPVLFHQNMFSAASIIGSAIGGFFGIWAAIKLNDYI